MRITSSGLDKRNMFTAAEVDQWLGLQYANDPQNPATQIVSATKPDPKCRFLYFWGHDSQVQLNITKDIVTKLLTYHQVMPVYIDFMSVFGTCTEERDLRFSGFREQSFMGENRRGLAIPGLRRSGRQFQLCYNLKCVTLHTENKEAPDLNVWSIRQAAIHHQFDVEEGTTLWIVTMGNLEIQQRFKELTIRDPSRPDDLSTFDTPEKCFLSSLEAHLVYCHWSTEDWRGYIRWLELVIAREVSYFILDIILISITLLQTDLVVYGPRGEGNAYEFYGPGTLQSMHRRQDKINEMTMILEGNVDVMMSLCKFYTNLKSNRHFPRGLKDSCGDDILAFCAQVEDMIYDLKGQIARATVLLKITNDRKELVSLSPCGYGKLLI